MQLAWYLSTAGVSGDSQKLLVVHEVPGGNRARRVECLFDVTLPFYRWRLRRALRRLRREWVRLYVSGLILECPYECVR